MADLLNRWKNGLERTRKVTFGRIASMLGATEITDQTWEDLEVLMVQSDMGVDTVLSVLDRVQRRVQEDGITQTGELRQAMHDELVSRLEQPPIIQFDQHPAIVLVVGVNGSGKTTTIAKLSQLYTRQNKRVLMVAADTYRAAAVDQLQVWADRLNIPIVAGQEGADPGSVAYDGVQAAVARQMDLTLVDTAGRLHTRYNLMEELKKVNRVVGKALPGAPHAVWLVLDATTGQNALQQARAFKEAVQVTGVILAKLDSSARGGMAFAIKQELGLPILFAGLGERPEDLTPFDPAAFVDGILANV